MDVNKGLSILSLGGAKCGALQQMWAEEISLSQSRLVMKITAKGVCVSLTVTFNSANLVHCRRRDSEMLTSFVVFWGAFIFSGGLVF